MSNQIVYAGHHRVFDDDGATWLHFQEDQNAEEKLFRFSRYVDGFDLSEFTCYLLLSGTDWVDRVELSPDETGEETLSFRWTVSAQATANGKPVVFQPAFFKDPVVLHLDKDIFTVSSSVEISDRTADFYPDLIGQKADRSELADYVTEAALTERLEQIGNEGSNVNQLINTDFRLHQRRSETTITGAGYGFDRWYATASAMTVAAQANTSPSNALNMLQVTRGTDPVAEVTQPLEDFATQWNGKTMSYSVWVKADEETALRIGIGAATHVYEVGTEWTQVRGTVTVASEASNEWYDNGFRIGIDEEAEELPEHYWFAAPQLVCGSYMTEYQPRQMAEEILLCRRYFEKSYGLSDAPGKPDAGGYERYICALSAAWSCSIRYAVPKRAKPTVTFYSRVGTEGMASVGGTAAANDKAISAYSNTTVALHPGIGASGMTAGAAIYFHWVADADVYE